MANAVTVQRLVVACQPLPNHPALQRRREAKFLVDLGQEMKLHIGTFATTKCICDLLHAANTVKTGFLFCIAVFDSSTKRRRVHSCLMLFFTPRQSSGVIQRLLARQLLSRNTNYVGEEPRVSWVVST